MYNLCKEHQEKGKKPRDAPKERNASNSSFSHHYTRSPVKTNEISRPTKHVTSYQSSSNGQSRNIPLYEKAMEKIKAANGAIA